MDENKNVIILDTGDSFIAMYIDNELYFQDEEIYLKTMQKFCIEENIDFKNIKFPKMDEEDIEYVMDNGSFPDNINELSGIYK